MSQSTWTYVRNLSYLLFGTDFFTAILEQKLHIYKQIHIQNSQTTMARIL